MVHCRILCVRRARPLLGTLRLVELPTLFCANRSLNGRLLDYLRRDLIEVHSPMVTTKTNCIVVGVLDGLRVGGRRERWLCDDVS